METLNELLRPVGLHVKAAGKAHARELGRLMRKKDREEIKAAGNWTDPERCVRASINHSKEAWAVYAGSDLLAVFGITIYPDYQTPWVLTTEAVTRHSFSFWKASKLIVPYLRDRYPLLMNMVHGMYPEALRWLERLGFTLHAPEKWGPQNSLFVRAVLETRSLIYV